MRGYSIGGISKRQILEYIFCYTYQNKFIDRNIQKEAFLENVILEIMIIIINIILEHDYTYNPACGFQGFSCNQ